MKVLSLTTASLLLLTSPALMAQASWTTLGSGSAADMSDDGQFVVGSSGGNAFLWSLSGGQTNLGQDDAVGVSSDGSVVFGNATDSGGNSVAARWTQATGWDTALGGLGGSSGSSITSAYGMSGDGSVGTGLGWINAGTAGAFRWTSSGGMSALPQSGPNSSRGNAVSEDGTYIGGWDEASNGTRRAAIWDGSLNQTLIAVSSTNPEGAGEAWGFSENNSYVAGGTQGEGFVWDAVNGVTKTGSLPSTDIFAIGEARGVSNDGTRVIGWYRVTFPFDTRATIWTPGGGIQELKTVLEANGAVNVPALTSAFAISADGTRILCNAFGNIWGIAELGPPGGPGTSYCFCDSVAPCGNLGSSDSGCANSGGSGAILNSAGTASIGADDLTFQCAQLPPGKPSLLFAGTAVANGGAGTLFGDGLICAGGTIQRLSVVFADGSGSASYGPGLAATWGWSSGNTLFFQVWNRDPAGPCNSGFNFSNATRVSFLP
jgi:hypothetical protein